MQLTLHTYTTKITALIIHEEELEHCTCIKISWQSITLHYITLHGKVLVRIKKLTGPT